MIQSTASQPAGQVTEAQANVAFLSRVISELRQQLEEERKQLPISQASIETDILKLEKQCEKVQAKIAQKKAKSKSRKQEIDDWKRWYNGIGHIDKTQAREQLALEIDWRAQAIAEYETQISQLGPEELAITGELEKKKMQLEAFLTGVYERPIAEDPRLTEAETALEEAQNALSAAAKID